MAPKVTIIDIFKGADRQWYWHARARNGQVIAASEAYTRRASAVRGAKRAFPGVTIRPS